ncbi:MAG: hypothetical protein JNN15_18570, partial [Blastocatellia bacterium]|nr:hypothetical protein [Blastocatellia bacterium]
NLQTAILLVRNYESSSADLLKLHATVQHLQRQQGLNIIVITQQQLVLIERKQTSLPILIKQKAENLKFNMQPTGLVDSSTPNTSIEKAPREPIRLPLPSPVTQSPPPSPSVAAAPPITVVTPPPTTPAPMTTVPPVKLPRLVIKSPASKAQKEPQPPTIYKTQTPRGTDPPLLLKACSNCKNPTSLSCKSCSKPLCNIHLDMKTLTCEECLRSGAEKPTDGFDPLSSTPIME